jgi:hypothetical protein
MQKQNMNPQWVTCRGHTISIQPDAQQIHRAVQDVGVFDFGFFLLLHRTSHLKTFPNSQTEADLPHKKRVEIVCKVPLQWKFDPGVPRQIASFPVQGCHHKGGFTTTSN